MRVESFVFLGIILVVWLIAFLGSWLRQELERQARAQEEAEALAAFPPSLEVARGAEEETVAGIEEGPIEPSPLAARPRSSKRFRYRSPHAMRQGVVLMTVFGPCKAFDRNHGSWLT